MKTKIGRIKYFLEIIFFIFLFLFCFLFRKNFFIFSLSDYSKLELDNKFSYIESDLDLIIQNEQGTFIKSVIDESDKLKQIIYDEKSKLFDFIKQLKLIIKNNLQNEEFFNQMCIFVNSIDQDGDRIKKLTPEIKSIYLSILENMLLIKTSFKNICEKLQLFSDDKFNFDNIKISDFLNSFYSIYKNINSMKDLKENFYKLYFQDIKEDHFRLIEESKIQQIDLFFFSLEKLIQNYDFEFYKLSFENIFAKYLEITEPILKDHPELNHIQSSDVKTDDLENIYNVYFIILIILVFILFLFFLIFIFNKVSKKR
ncbi:hypothetical protein [Candidatus Phytoplasma sacchari]|uniref:Uncharacterized protein n=1 Tax=Candidatus Phytoplasma sacchari TaxID=2609813 RepID=A0ABY7M480_9MOLU|nr:hypothetical protein O7R10_00195 [Candidatus Phytoplasma sacchari]